MKNLARFTATKLLPSLTLITLALAVIVGGLTGCKDKDVYDRAQKLAAANERLQRDNHDLKKRIAEERRAHDKAIAEERKSDASTEKTVRALRRELEASEREVALKEREALHARREKASYARQLGLANAAILDIINAVDNRRFGPAHRKQLDTLLTITSSVSLAPEEQSSVNNPLLSGSVSPTISAPARRSSRPVESATDNKIPRGPILEAIAEFKRACDAYDDIVKPMSYHSGHWTHRGLRIASCHGMCGHHVVPDWFKKFSDEWGRKSGAIKAAYFNQIEKQIAAFQASAIEPEDSEWITKVKIDMKDAKSKIDNFSSFASFFDSKKHVPKEWGKIYPDVKSILYRYIRP